MVPPWFKSVGLLLVGLLFIRFSLCFMSRLQLSLGALIVLSSHREVYFKSYRWKP